MQETEKTQAEVLLRSAGEVGRQKDSALEPAKAPRHIGDLARSIPQEENKQRGPRRSQHTIEVPIAAGAAKAALPPEFQRKHLNVDADNLATFTETDEPVASVTLQHVPERSIITAIGARDHHVPGIP